MNTSPAPQSTRRADGWAAILAFPNGGRQLFTSRHATMASALEEARHAAACRIHYPSACVPDPAPNSLVILAELAR